MIELEQVTEKGTYINQHLFSEAYLQDIYTSELLSDSLSANYMLIRSWREQFTPFSDLNTRQRYVAHSLSTLQVPYELQANRFFLYTSFAHEQRAGICLVVDDQQLDRTEKGYHYHAQLIQLLRSYSLQWGILTNGSRWRLCDAHANAPYEVFLEINLDAILTTPNQQHFALFSLFSQFFGVQAFSLLPKGHQSEQGDLFIQLNQYSLVSKQYSALSQQHLKGHLQSIMELLCLGFLENEPAPFYEPEMLDKIYVQATYLLCRILFLFYAEANELLPIYHEQYAHQSLLHLVQEIRAAQENYSQKKSTWVFWERLNELFVIVDRGKDELDVKPYNGGLFSNTGEKRYLDTHKIADAYLTKVLFYLGYMPEGGTIRLINYRDLSVRHLSTLYEKLLEYRLRVVHQEPVVIRGTSDRKVYPIVSQAGFVARDETILEEGKTYVDYDENRTERKSTGSYYTPEDVVYYIVSRTVAPKLQAYAEILQKKIDPELNKYSLATSERERHHHEQIIDQITQHFVAQYILGLRILDPAMGCAHFLVAAGQVVTNFVVELFNTTPWGNLSISTSPMLWKRRIVEQCLYGVDNNPLAQEFAKLAFWLDSAWTNKPLVFLDHHLKIGNSLYGAPLEKLSTLPHTKKWGNDRRAQEIYNRIVHTSDYQQLSVELQKDSEIIQDVKGKYASYKKQQKAFAPLRELANVWLANCAAPLKEQHQDIPEVLDEATYSRLLDCLLDHYPQKPCDLCKFFLDQAVSKNQTQQFFHWELEFPDAVAGDRCLFDIIVTNPPYVPTSPDQIISTLYTTAPCRDLYAWMAEFCWKHITETGYLGTVVPLSLLFSQRLAPLRSLLLHHPGELYCASFDIRPGSLFGTSDAPNSQRACICISEGNSGQHIRVYTTDLLRWTPEERPLIFQSLQFAEVTPFATSLHIPKLGDSSLLTCWEYIEAYEMTVGSVLYDPKKNKPKNGASTLFNLFVSSTARYFLTATPMAPRRTGFTCYTFADEWLRDVAMVTLNSNLFYWFWSVLGDGFHVTTPTVKAMVLPQVEKGDEVVLHLRDRLYQASPDCRVEQKLARGSLVNYNFNLRPDILFEIDQWLLQQIAPDLSLPQEIFFQYKSRSFLHRDKSAFYFKKTEE